MMDMIGTDKFLHEALTRRSLSDYVIDHPELLDDEYCCEWEEGYV